MLIDGQARVAALALMAAWAPQLRCRVRVSQSDFFGHFVGTTGTRQDNWKNKAAAMAKRVARRRAKKGYR